MPYIGNNQLPFDPSRSLPTPRDVDRFSGNGSTTAFTLSRVVNAAVDIEVFVENVQQEPLTAYDVNGTTLTFTGAPSSGTNNIYVNYRAYNTGAQVTVPDGSITYAKLANNIRIFTTDNLTPNGNNAVFTLTEPPADANTVMVTIDGVLQRAPVHYTTSGSTITFTSNPPANANVHVRHLGFRTTTTLTQLAANSFISQPNIASPTITGGTISDSNIASPTLSGNITVSGNITSNVYLTGNAGTKFAKTMSSDGTAFEVFSSYDGSSIVRIGQSSSDGYITIGDPSFPATSSSADIWLTAGGGCHIKNALHLGKAYNATYSNFPIAIYPGEPRGTSGNARIKIGTHIIDSYANDDLYLRGYNSETTGALLYVGGYYTFSARSIKSNIQPLENSLEKICSLNGYSYTITETGRDDIGLIADEVEQIYPDLVAHDTETGEANSVDYSSLVAALVEAVKELKTELDTVKAELNSLKQE